MRIVFLFFIFINLFPVYSQDTINQKDSLDRKQGYWIIYGKDRPDLKMPLEGKVEEGHYVNDRKEGLWIKYHDDGITPKIKGGYMNGRPTGSYIKFGPNGSIRETGNFEKNQYKDSIKRYQGSNQLEYEAWYNENGREEGRVNSYYPNGQLEYTYCAKNGTPYDIYHYDISGKLISNEPNPIICPTSTEKRICSETDTLPPPKIPETSDTRNIPFKPNSYNKIFNEDQEILQDGTFKNGLLWDGKVYVYDRDGILLKVSIYKEGAYCCDGQL